MFHCFNCSIVYSEGATGCCIELFLQVEEGGKAGVLQHPLEPGDQVVTINHVELSGSRQEAISLVKGSYKTLRLIVSR